MRIGSRAAVLSLIAGVGLVLLFGSPLAGGKKKEKAPESYSVVAGSVFREPGFALPDAEVTLSAADESGAPKGRKLEFTTNTRGEFAFRLPSLKADYVVAARAKGYARQQKSVTTEPNERIDVTFMLVPESK